MQHPMAVLSDDRPTARTRARVGIAVYLGAVVGALAYASIVNAHAAWVLRGAVGLFAVVGALIAARRSRRVGVNPWLCIAIGVALWTTGALVRGLSGVQSVQISHAADAMSLLGYVAVGAGVAVIARIRSDAASRDEARGPDQHRGGRTGRPGPGERRRGAHQ